MLVSQTHKLVLHLLRKEVNDPNEVNDPDHVQAGIAVYHAPSSARGAILCLAPVLLPCTSRRMSSLRDHRLRLPSVRPAKRRFHELQAQG